VTIGGGTANVAGNVATTTPKGNATITTTPTNVATTTPVPSPNVTVTTTAPSNVTSNVTKTTSTTPIPKPATTPTSKNPLASTFGTSSSTLGSALLGSALSSQPEPAVTGGGTSSPYLLGTDEAKKNVWNQESLRNALGI